MTNLPNTTSPPPDKRVLEWIRQSDYDFDTAMDMMKSKRYIYAVFMCHLAIEKALKGLHQHILQTVPPKTHSLTFLINQIGHMPPVEQKAFITTLELANLTTRYPDELEKIQKQYTKAVVTKIITNSREVIAWIKQQL